MLTLFIFLHLLFKIITYFNYQSVFLIFFYKIVLSMLNKITVFLYFFNLLYLFTYQYLHSKNAEKIRNKKILLTQTFYTIIWSRLVHSCFLNSNICEKFRLTECVCSYKDIFEYWWYITLVLYNEYFIAILHFLGL